MQKNILILNNIIPFPLTHGNALRVYHLSRELARYHNLFLASFNYNKESYNLLNRKNLYKEIIFFEKNNNKQSFIRHMYLTAGHLYKKHMPGFYFDVVEKLQEYIKEKRITHVISITLKLAEFMDELKNVIKIVDDYDCATLTLLRKKSAIKNNYIEAIKHARQLWRIRNQESRLTRKYDCITTISPVDADVLRKLNKDAPDRIHVIPNGINPELICVPQGGSEIPNSIAFWGALDFLPNISAVKHFYENVYSEYLEQAGVKWYIVGPNPPEWLAEIGGKHEKIIVTGFVDDLFGLVSRIPIMINPMIMGAGLKNKVLEAFALERLVISSPMGIEALAAEPGEHYIPAEGALDWAKAVIEHLENDRHRKRIARQARLLALEKYTWDLAGIKLNSLIQ